MNIQDWLPTLYSAAGLFTCTAYCMIPYKLLLISNYLQSRHFNCNWLIVLSWYLGGDHLQLPSMDGMDMWKALLEDTASPRNLMLHNIDDTRHIAAVRVAEWKFIRGLRKTILWHFLSFLKRISLIKAHPMVVDGMAGTVPAAEGSSTSMILMPCFAPQQPLPWKQSAWKCRTMQPFPSSGQQQPWNVHGQKSSSLAS